MIFAFCSMPSCASRGKRCTVNGLRCTVNGLRFTVYLLAQFVYFLFQLFVLCHFSLEKVGGYSCFLLYTVWSQQVHVAGLVVGGFEAFYFYGAFFDQFPEAVVEFAEAEAHLLGHLALGEIGRRLKELEEAVVDFGVHALRAVCGSRFTVCGSIFLFMS